MINKALIIGNVGKDPEIRNTPSGKKVANFSVATTEKYGDRKSTEWHKVVAWEKLADIIEKYVKKGTKIYIEGKLATRSWERDGNKFYTTEIIAHTMQMLGGKPEQEEQMGNTDPSLPF